MEKKRINAEKIIQSGEKRRQHSEKRKLLMEDRDRAAAQMYKHTVMKNLRSMERRNQEALMLKKAHESYVCLFYIFSFLAKRQDD